NLGGTAGLTNQFLQYNGTNWVPANGSGSTAPGGTNGALQYNNSGVFGGAVITGLVKGNGTSAPAAATSGTDYLAPPSGTAIQKANSGGALSNAVSGTDYQAPIAGNTLGANNFATSISAAGTISGAQPAFSNLSGNIATSQMNSGTSASSSTF